MLKQFKNAHTLFLRVYRMSKPVTCTSPSLPRFEDDLHSEIMEVVGLMTISVMNVVFVASLILMAEPVLFSECTLTASEFCAVGGIELSGLTEPSCHVLLKSLIQMIIMIKVDIFLFLQVGQCYILCFSR